VSDIAIEGERSHAEVRNFTRSIGHLLHREQWRGLRFLGANGAGKTTAMRMLIGLASAEAGHRARRRLRPSRSRPRR